MNVEIKGVNFINKGAELMLRSIIQEFEDRNHQARFGMNLKDIALAPDKMDELEFYPWRYSKKVPFLGKTLNFFFDKAGISTFRGRKVMVRDEIDVILDASGFVYSDQWGPESAEVMADYYEEAKAKGQKVILLPQAFGPFETERLKNAMKNMIPCTDLVFARDQVSYEALKSLIPGAKNIAISPDFTIKAKPGKKEDLQRYYDKVCIIPNYRMVDMREGGNYLEFLNHLVEYLNEKNQELFFLIHEKDKDRSLVDSLANKRGESYDVVFKEHPLDIKGVIGSSKYVVGSRFHGIVSALTQNIPTIATGWSHKYKMLFQEYELEELFVDDLVNRSHLISIIDQLEMDDFFHSVKRKLEEKNRDIQAKVDNMWDEVFSVVENV